MALTQKTSIGSIQIDDRGNVGVLLKLVIADGDNELSKDNHRLMLTKDGDVTSTFREVNAHLGKMGREPISATDEAVIMATANAYWAAQGSR